jgi:uncharacterized protein YqgC (DUF456 family)
MLAISVNNIVSRRSAVNGGLQKSGSVGAAVAVNGAGVMETGWFVGLLVGEIEGNPVGEVVGLLVGPPEGELVGDVTGAVVGELDWIGEFVGAFVEAGIGACVGVLVGVLVACE